MFHLSDHPSVVVQPRATLTRRRQFPMSGKPLITQSRHRVSERTASLLPRQPVAGKLQRRILSQVKVLRRSPLTSSRKQQTPERRVQRLQTAVITKKSIVPRNRKKQLVQRRLPAPGYPARLRHLNQLKPSRSRQRQPVVIPPRDAG